MNTVTIRDIAKLEALAGEWEALHGRVPFASPFQHPSWLLPWWAHFGSGELLTFAMRDQGRLAGIVPLFLHEWNGRRQVTLLGTGCSDYLGVLAEPASRYEVEEQLWERLYAERHRWDLCDLQDLGPRYWVNGCGPLQFALVPQYTCAEMPLPGSADLYFENLPHGLRRNLRRYRQKLDEQGSVAFHKATNESFRGAFQSMIRLHELNWSSRSEEGMFCGTLRDFHQRAAHTLAEQDIARCYTMTLNDRPIAAIYGFLDKKRFWSYQCGFLPEMARFSPGSLMLEFVLRDAIASGATQFDFLRGEEEYKRTWGARFGISFRLVLWHREAPAEFLLAS